MREVWIERRFYRRIKTALLPGLCRASLEAGLKVRSTGTQLLWNRAIEPLDYPLSPGTASKLGMHAAKLGKCINPDCQAEFKRLGTGRIYSLQVTEPQAWGLPAHVRQKVVWLCSACERFKEAEFDLDHYQVRVLSRPQRRQSA